MSPVDRRVTVAFILQPFVCAVLGVVLFPLLALTHPGRTVDMFQAALAFGVVTGIVAVLIAGIAAATFGRLRNRGPITLPDTAPWCGLRKHSGCCFDRACVTTGGVIRRRGRERAHDRVWNGCRSDEQHRILVDGGALRDVEPC